MERGGGGSQWRFWLFSLGFRALLATKGGGTHPGWGTVVLILFLGSQEEPMCDAIAPPFLLV